MVKLKKKKRTKIFDNYPKYTLKNKKYEEE